MPINTAVNPPEYWAPFINVKCSHPLCLKACQAEFSDVFLSSTIVFAPQKLLCQSFFLFFFWCIAATQKFPLCYSSSITMINCSLFCYILQLWGQSAQCSETMTPLFLPSAPLLIKNNFLLSAYRSVDAASAQTHTHTDKRMIQPFNWGVKVPLVSWEWF